MAGSRADRMLRSATSACLSHPVTQSMQLVYIYLHSTLLPVLEEHSSHFLTCRSSEKHANV